MTTERAARLRFDFDRGFARARDSAVEAGEALVTIRVAGDPYALRVRELSGLFADRVIEPVPGKIRELLGIAGFRGAILPVFDLGALLGYAATANPRWLATAACEPVAIGFPAFDGYRRVPREALVAHAGARHVSELVHVDGTARPIIDITSVATAITRRRE